ncbi:MAG: restriction endonuclease [Proteobacteria bacterium]|nr:restriction endonuclease [Pseudomonadota bacterium]
MARRDSHVLVELARMPWWVSVLFAAGVYAGLRWIIPSLLASHAPLVPLGRASAAYAHWLALVFLLPVPFAIFRQVHRRRLVEGQASIERLRALSWQDFERLVGEAFRRQGYRVTERGGGGPDGGVDLELRTKDKTLLVQCKRWKMRTVGVEVVRELYGVVAGEEAHGAIFVTSGRYTPDATHFARDKPIKLIDGSELARMLGSLKSAPNERSPAKRSSAKPSSSVQPLTSWQQPEAPKHAPVIPLPELPPTKTTGAVSISEPCPRCGSRMVLRTTKKGAGVGSKFWGCSRYPACRGTRGA